MMTATLTKESADFAGFLITLTYRGTLAFERKTEGADYTVTLDGYEVGVAWEKISREKGTLYLSVKLDLPFLSAPVFGALIPQDDGSYTLAWNRPGRPGPEQED